jgi:hypothetical protein
VDWNTPKPNQFNQQTSCKSSSLNSIVWLEMMIEFNPSYISSEPYTTAILWNALSSINHIFQFDILLEFELHQPTKILSMQNSSVGVDKLGKSPQRNSGGGLHHVQCQ